MEDPPPDPAAPSDVSPDDVVLVRVWQALQRATELATRSDAFANLPEVAAICVLVAADIEAWQAGASGRPMNAPKT